MVRRTRIFHFGIGLILLAIVSLSGSIGEKVSSETSGYFQLRARVTTTSDWTQIIISGATLGALTEQVQADPGAQNLRVKAERGLSISKKQFDATRVTAIFTVFLADWQAPQLAIEVRKGDIGSTRIELFNANAEPERLIATYTSDGNIPGDPTNFRSFTVAAEAIQEGGPLTFPPAPAEKKVLAFYYPWYGTPSRPGGQWFHWNPQQRHYASTHTPLAGYYDSQDERTIERHIREARQAGIDAFIASWWGIASFEDQALERIITVAERMGFQVTIYYEQARSRDQILRDVRYILSKYAGSPAFLKIQDRPVLFFYGRVTGQFAPEDWAYVFQQLSQEGLAAFSIADGFQEDLIRGFEGVHTYNPVTLPLEQTRGLYRSNALRAKAIGKLFAATVVPGYDDRNVRQPGFVQDRQGGDYYRASWDAATSSQPHWILVTSFNEWHEGSEIEPSVEFGDQYLELTRELAERWKAPSQ
ncbi:MAG: hypothetical protein HY314_02100 [Acidobacteria bacterium]|nr:hypothetical protein [Acidobacteriota bacterium]